jgi:hypothetical protein
MNEPVSAQKKLGTLFSCMNALNVIYPYKYQGTWVFDDERVGLVQEPFISGADLIIDRLTTHLSNSGGGFRLIFSAMPFPGATLLEWHRTDIDGNWYYCPEVGVEGWLCPALLHYFETAPKRLYAKCEAKGG